MGRKMALMAVRAVLCRSLKVDIPEKEEENHHENREHSGADILGFLEYLDQAVHESG
jgi:hypothetical protein